MAKLFWHRIPIERCCALFYYHSHCHIELHAVYQLKYHASVLKWESIWADCWPTKGLAFSSSKDIDAIIPIPTHPKTRKKTAAITRARQIAKGIQQTHPSPHHQGCRKKGKRFSESQTHKNRWQRQENVRHVFAACQHTYHDGAGQAPHHRTCRQTSPHHRRRLHHRSHHHLLLRRTCMKAGKMKFSIATIGWAQTQKPFCRAVQNTYKKSIINPPIYDE